MGNFVFNIAKGKVAHYASLPAANDALVAVPIETTGIESDAILQDYDNLSALLAGPSNEQTTTMSRKTLASVTVTVNDTDNRVEVDCADPTWVTPAAGNAVSKLIVCYDPDTTAGTDADLIPLVGLDFVVTPSGVDITYQVAAGGFYQAS